MKNKELKMESTKLSYYVPFIGHIEVTLHNESEKVYNWLNQANEITRLKNLDHLGAIRFAWEGAHHPRWEYISFILYLIDYCKENVGETHLGSRVDIPAHSINISSGSELLKCWALLFNVGHLEWTFFTERCLLLELKNSRDKRNEFLKFFSGDNELKEWAKNIINKCEFYRFFQTLAFIRLESIADKAPEELKWKEIMKAFVIEKNDNPKISRLRKLYRDIRRLAYLTLDPHYTPAGLQFNFTQLFSIPSLPLLGRLLQPNTTEEKLLTSFEHLLYENVYLNEDVIKAMSERESKLMEKISNYKNSLVELINDLAEGKIQQELEKTATYKKMCSIARLSIWLDPSCKDSSVEIPDPCLFQEELKKLRIPRELKGQISIIIWPGPNKNTLVAQFHASAENEKAKLWAYFCAFRFAILLRKKLKIKIWKDNPYYRKLFERLASELIVKALNLIYPTENLKWEWQPISDEPVAVFTNTENAKKYLKELESNANLSKDIKGEISAKLEVLEKSKTRGEVALSIGNLKAYQNKNTFCEIDGCLVRLKNNKIVVTLIEAKTERSGGISKAKEQLVKILNKLNVLNVKDSDIKPYKVKSTSFAFVEIPICRNPQTKLKSIAQSKTNLVT